MNARSQKSTRDMMRRAALLPLLVALACGTPADAPVAATPVPPVDSIIPSVPCAGTLGKFGGLQWNARADALSGPGPNVWDACNAWLAADGMHLRVQLRNGAWTSAEVYTTEALGYGSFEFELATRADTLDRNLVLGLFTYPGGAQDGRHEIDIEFARFGSTTATAANLDYAVYPATAITTSQGRCALRWDSPAAASVHRFMWTANAVRFQSFAATTVGATTVPNRSWSFVPTGNFQVSGGSWPLHLNLWLFGGQAPANGQPFEVVIRRVSYSATLPQTPSPSATCG